MDDKKKTWWMEIDRQSDVDTLEGSKEAKELLIESDDVKLPEDDDFFDNLHDKIMASVAVTELKKDNRTFRQKHKKLVKGFSAAMLIAAVLMVGLETQQVGVTPDGTDEVLSDAVSRSPDIQETVLVYQNKDDFFVDLAQESLDHLSVDHLQGLMGSELAD